MMKATCCPTCGGAIDLSAMRYESEAGILISGGRFVALSRQEGILFEAFLEKPGRVLTKQYLLNWLYSLSPDEDPEIKIIDVFVCKIRKKLEGMPVTITTVWGHGYRLIKEV